MVNFENYTDNIDSPQECGVLPKCEPKVEVTTDSDLYSVSDDESVEEYDTVNGDQFAEELITLPPARPGSTINAHGLCRSTRTSMPPQVTKLSFQNKRYDLDWWNKVVQGTNHLNVDQWNKRDKATGRDYKVGTMYINVQDSASFTYGGSAALEEIIGVAMAQHFSIRYRLKHFGDRGEKAVRKELTQLHKMHTYDPVDPKKFTKKQSMDALNSLMLLIEKRNGSVKALSCADGSKQRK